MVKVTDPIILVQGDKAEQKTKDGRHSEKIFNVKRKTLKSGKIVLELSPATKLEQEREDLINELTEKLKDNIDKEDLMRDVLTDVSITNLKKLGTAIKRGATVKAKEGCYNIRIKDPRKKKPYSLQIRK